MGDIPIGIDFGTSYSCVAVCRDGKVEVIANENDSRLTPSYVAFTEEERLFGEAAKYQAPLNLQNTIHQTKRLLGGKHDEKLEKYLGYNISRTSDQLRIPVTHQRKEISLSPEQISAMIIGKMKKIAENKLGEGTVSRAVISVPASFDKAQQKAIFNAGKIAGFAEVRLIHETTAAAVAYGLDREKEGTRSVLIIDFGGGKFDAAIVAIDKRKFDVVASTGNSTFGGQDIDIAFAEDYIEEEDRKDKKAICRLQTACEKAKRALSGATKTRVSVDYFTGGKPFKTEVRREDFVINHKDIFSEVHKILEDVLRKGKMKKDMVDEIVLVGGSTRIPKIREIIKEYFDKELSRTINPDEAVAIGAAYHAYYTFHKPIGGYEITGENVPDPKADDNLNELRKQHIQFDKDDKAITENSDARNELENYVNSIKKMVRSPKHKDELTEEQKKKILELCTTTIDWLDDHQDATKNEADEKRKSLEELYPSQVASTGTDADDINVPEEKDKLINDIKEIINKVQDERFDSFTKKEDIVIKCPRLISRLESEKGVTLEDIYKMRKDFKENFYTPLQQFEKHKNATETEIKAKRNDFLSFSEEKFRAMKLDEQREAQSRMNEKEVNKLKQVLETNATKAKQQPFNKYGESEKILKRCNSLRTRLKNDQVAEFQEIKAKVQDFSEYCTQIFQQIKANEQRIQTECIGRGEEDLRLCSKLREDLKTYIKQVRSKAEERRFEKSQDKNSVLQNCLELEKWLNGNQGVSADDIVKTKKEFQEFFEDCFKNMENQPQISMNEMDNFLNKMENRIKMMKSDDTTLLQLRQRCIEMRKLLRSHQANPSNVTEEYFKRIKREMQESSETIFQRIESKESMQRLVDVIDKYEDLKRQNLSLLGGERENSNYNAIKEWISTNPDAGKSECDDMRKNMEAVYQALKINIGTKTTNMKRELQQIKANSGKLKNAKEEKLIIQAKASLEGYIWNIKEYIQNPANKRRLAEIHKIIEKECKHLLRWLSSDKIITVEMCEEKRRDFDTAYKQYIGRMKQEDKNAFQEMRAYLQTVLREFEKIEKIKLRKDGGEYSKSLCNIRLWINNNENAVMPECEEKMQQLSEIHQFALGIIKKEILSSNNTKHTDEQRKARADLEGYRQGIVDYVNHPDENRISLEKKQSYIRECKNVLEWMQLEKNATTDEYRSKQEQLVAKCGADIKQYQQQDKVAQQVLNTLWGQFKQMTESRPELKQQCGDIGEWMMKNPNASKPQYEKKTTELKSILNNLRGNPTKNDKGVIAEPPKRFRSPYDQKNYQGRKTDQLNYRKETFNQSTRNTNITTWQGGDGHADEFIVAGQHLKRQKRRGQVNESESTVGCMDWLRKTPNISGSGGKRLPSRPQDTIDEMECAIADLRYYVASVNHKLKEDNSLTATQRRNIWGACNGIENWLSSKCHTLDEIRTKKKSLENKCSILFQFED